MTRAGTLNAAELRALLATASGRRHRAGERYRFAQRDALFLELVAIAGLRPSEAIAIAVRDLPPAPEDPTLVVRFRGRDRRVMIPWRIASRLWAHVSREELLLEQRLFAFNLRRARQMFRLYAMRAGLKPVHTLDSLRGYGAAIAWRRESNLTHVAARLGNCSMAAAQRFVANIEAQGAPDPLAA